MTHTITNTDGVNDYILYNKPKEFDKMVRPNFQLKTNAAYSILGRSIDTIINYSFVGEAVKLRYYFKKYFEIKASNHCLRQFRQSINLRAINHLITDGPDTEERQHDPCKWQEKYYTNCNDQLNKTY